MKLSQTPSTLLLYASTAFAVVASLEERQAGSPTGTLTEPPGSVLASPTVDPVYTPTASIQGVSLDAKFSWQIYKSCPDANRAAINTAWADSKRLTDALASYVLNGAYQDTVNMYMGTRSTYRNILRDPPYDFPSQINNTIQRRQGLYAGLSSTGTANLWVYCNEDSFWFHLCLKDDNPPRALLAYENEDIYFNNWYITFCPQFFNSSWQIPLQQVESNLKASNPYPNVLESYAKKPGNQAATFFHEQMHMAQLVTAPQAVDLGYGPLNAYNLAKNKNTDSAIYNADSWTMTALAIWAQQTFNLESPPEPAAIIYPPTPPPAVQQKEEPTDEDSDNDVIYLDAGAVVPQGASAVPPGTPYYVDPSLWEVQNPAGGSVTVVSPAQTSSVQPPPAYATGTCSLHLTETQDCTSDATNLYAIVTLYDNNKVQIGQTGTSPTNNPIGDPINSADPYSFDSELPIPIVIVGEHVNDYVQFSYGSLLWNSSTTSGPATCTIGGWDPSRPECEGKSGDVFAVNNIDCSFSC